MCRAVRAPAHLPPLIEPDLQLNKPTSLAVGNGFTFPKIENDGSDVGSPLKFEQPKPTTHMFFQRDVVDPIRFVLFLG